jgi:hypothetical protein
MKLTILMTAIALVPASAQLAPMKQAPPASVAAKPDGTIGTLDRSPASLQAIIGLEKEMDTSLGTTGGSTDPCVVRGPSRGLYVNGLGVVFTAEVELAGTPGLHGLFGTQSQVGPEEKGRYHKIKMERLPVLEQRMRDIVGSLAASPALKLADNEQVVVSVRLWYQRWEDTTGLPGQIVARLDHRGGTVKVDVQ